MSTSNVRYPTAMNSQELRIDTYRVRFPVIFVVLAMILLMHGVCLRDVAGQDTRPYSIPAIREWVASSGTYVFSSRTRIRLDSGSASMLQGTAATFARDMAFLTGLTLPVGIDSGTSGDIILSLDPAQGTYKPEGYTLSITDRIVVAAGSETGVFNGTRTLLQLIRQDTIIGCGTARDWPDYPERGMMVDVGRKYFSMQWLENHIVDLAYLKMNVLHLHFSDDLGIRLQSSEHPEIVSSQYYSKNEIQRLVALANQYHVSIIPEIDVPGHTGWLRNSRPELILGNNATGTYYMDITQKASRDLVRDLLLEFLPWFPGTYWHTGADEYIGADNYANYPQLESWAKSTYGAAAQGFDAYLGFICFIDSLVRAHGKTLRTWADAYEYSSMSSTATVKLDTSIVQELWNAYQEPGDIIRHGYTIQNASFHPTYYNLGAYQGEVDTLYEDWAPHLRFGGWGRDEWGYPISIAAHNPKLLGAKLSIWCDYPDEETEIEVAQGIRNRLRAISQNCWGSPKLVSTYAAFEAIVDTIGRAPGYGQKLEVAVRTDKVQRQAAAAPLRLSVAAHTSGRLQLSCYLPGAAVVDFVVYDVRGRQLLSWQRSAPNPGWHHEVVSLGRAASGLYCVKLATTGTGESKMVILSR